MSESIPKHSSSVARPHRTWLIVATAGLALALLALITTALVAFDKPHFGWLVGSGFLGIIMSGTMAGGLLLLIGAWKLPGRASWRGITLIIWALTALTSPAFGIVFLLPWTALALTSPLVIAILARHFRSA